MQQRLKRRQQQHEQARTFALRQLFEGVAEVCRQVQFQPRTVQACTAGRGKSIGSSSTGCSPPRVLTQ
jgi:hypothetical protein